MSKPPAPPRPEDFRPVTQEEMLEHFRKHKERQAKRNAPKQVAPYVFVVKQPRRQR